MTKKKVGRPSKRKKINLKKAEKLAEDGFTNNQLAEEFGVSPATISTYLKDWEDFSEAIKRGKDKADRKVEMSLFKRATGFEYDEITYEKTKPSLGIGVKRGEEKDIEVMDIKAVPMYKTKIVTKQVVPDTVACIFWLKNRKPEAWREKQEINLGGQKDNPIEVVGIEDKSTQEIIEFIGEKLRSR